MSPSWEYLWNQSLGIIHYAPYSSGHWNALESLACLPSLGQANMLMLYNDTQNLRWHIASYQVNDKCRYFTGLKGYIKVEICNFSQFTRLFYLFKYLLLPTTAITSTSLMTIHEKLPKLIPTVAYCHNINIMIFGQKYHEIRFLAPSPSLYIYHDTWYPV